jgi:hypothetical protein
VQYTAIAQMYLSMAEILYLWARAPTLDAEFDETRCLWCCSRRQAQLARGGCSRLW